jgi:ABC-type transport system involved in multi-copper enzyme maturation permease subunit
MTAKTTRLLKEARPLFWPWCAVIVAGVLLLAHPPQSIGWISPIGFFLGIPLLATLSLGNEFQHRTLSLLLSQPVGRMVIWGEKLSVTIVAVLSAVLVFSLALRATSFHPDRQELAFAGAWIVAITASATFWTLFTRSTVGGIALNVGVHFFIITLAWLKVADRIRGAGYLSPENPTVLAVTFLFLCYAGVMLWLGRRALARFQVTGGMAGDDLLMAGPDVMPGAWAGWLRCRPTGAVLNLIRKELRLLRPVWLISLLAAAGWACLTLFGLLYERGFSRNFETAVVMLGAFSTLIAVLAGSLSLGEERTSGTHSWHMTLPVSARRQWLIKLFVALFAGISCAVLLPVLLLIAGGFRFGSPFMFVDVHTAMVWLLMASLLTFASFWCACAVNGTVRAVLWLLPMMGALLLAIEFSEWVARELMDLFFSRFDPFADFRFTNAVSNINFFVIRATPMPFLALLLVPALLFAVIQSYRLFRTQLQDRTLSVIRNVLPLALLAFMSGFLLLASYVFLDRAKLQMWAMFRETHEAIEKIQPGTPNLDATHPLQLTVEDLAKASPFSERTRRWLRNSRITVAPDKPHPGRSYCCGGNSRSITFAPDKAYSWYLATIDLASGSHCTLSFQAGHGWGILGGVCE